jgi:predicted O-methyltransferase YrrM
MSWTDRAIKIARHEGYACLFKKAARYVLEKMVNIWPFGYAMVNMSKYRLKKSLIEISELDDIVNFAFCFRCLGINIMPAQVKEEILELLKLLQKHRLETLLEIGTGNGGTLFLFSRIASTDAVLLSIDLPGGPFGGGYPKCKTLLYESFALHNQKIYLLRADSHEKITLDAIKRILKGRRLDFLFIDGDHTYEGVKRDFEMYSPLVDEGGIIAFHDIVSGPPENVVGVMMFWNEIKKNYKYLEIIKKGKQGGHGIGILYF